MSVELNNKNQTYSYTMGCGPIRFKCSSSAKRDFNRLDRLMECLNQPNVEAATFFGQFGRRAGEVRVIFARLLNFVTTGTWMNEEAARKLVKQYAKLENSQKRPEQTKRIQSVYDRLAQIKRDDGTYATGIDRGALEPRVKEAASGGIPSPQRLYSLLVEDPRLQEAVKLVGNVAVEVLALVVKTYGCEVASRTAAAALAPLVKSRTPAASRVFTV